MRNEPGFAAGLYCFGGCILRQIAPPWGPLQHLISVVEFSRGLIFPRRPNIAISQSEDFFGS